MTMRPVHVLAPAALLAASVAGAVLAGEPFGNAEAVFEDARAKDQLIGVLNQTSNELHVTFTVPAGTKLNLNAAPDTTLVNGANGLAFRLCDPEGNDLGITGSEFDKSKPEKDKVKWKKVPLPDFGTYTLVAGAGTPGGMGIEIALDEANGKVDVTSEEPLPVDDTATVPFDGREDDTLKYDLQKSGKGSKFKGELFQVKRPDGTLLPLEEGDAKAKGKLLLDADGRHELLFKNVGKEAGTWRAKLTVKPRGSKKRKGLVSAPQTGVQPKVKTVDPEKAFNLDTALRVTITGREFQEGLDARLVRKNRTDILGTDIEFVSDEEVSFVVDLDTTETEGDDSIGNWTVSVWNQPIYDDPEDRTTLDRRNPLFDESKKLKSVSSASVKLPGGVEDNTEVWQLVFNDDFQGDLDRMNLGSESAQVRNGVNSIVQAYVVAYVRDLLLINETNGAVKGAAIPMSFVIDDITAVAGKPGIDYNRIEIGGEYQEGDPRATLDPLEWGFSARDVGNQQRDDLMVHDEEGNRIGLGARTRVLSVRNNNDQASSSFRQAMEPLRLRPLTANDARYFVGQFNPNNPGQIARYAEIVEQIERASREIAAIIAHHIGRSMGLATAGEGPMASPSFSGEMWVERASLDFSSANLGSLRLTAVPHEMPGKSDRLKIAFFPIIDRQAELLSPNLITAVPYSIKWEYVGGRCNAVPSDYRVSYARGSEVPIGLTLSFEGLSGTAPVCIGGQCTDVSNIYCGILEFAVIVEDIPRDKGSFLLHRLKVLPNVPLLPTQLQVQGQQCRDAVIQAP
jgi:hypothetical protein